MTKSKNEQATEELRHFEEEEEDSLTSFRQGYYLTIVPNNYGRMIGILGWPNTQDMRHITNIGISRVLVHVGPVTCQASSKRLVVVYAIRTCLGIIRLSSKVEKCDYLFEQFLMSVDFSIFLLCFLIINMELCVNVII